MIKLLTLPVAIIYSQVAIWQLSSWFISSEPLNKYKVFTHIIYRPPRVAVYNFTNPFPSSVSSPRSRAAVALLHLSGQTWHFSWIKHCAVQRRQRETFQSCFPRVGESRRAVWEGGKGSCRKVRKVYKTSYIINGVPVQRASWRKMTGKDIVPAVARGDFELFHLVWLADWRACVEFKKA